MASELVEEHPEIQEAPLISEEPATKPPPLPSPEPKVDSEQVLDGHGDQAPSQDPGSQESQPPEEPTQPVTSEDSDESLLGISFPEKLWVIVEDDTFKSLHWGVEKDTLVIEADLLQGELLDRKGSEKIFESESLKSFIRYLNLYGFRKIRPKKSAAAGSQENTRMMMYRNPNFQQDNPALLENIYKKGERRIFARRATCAPRPPKNPAGQETGAPSAKRKKLVATRHSPRFQREVNAEQGPPQSEAPGDQGPTGTQTFMVSGLWAMSNLSGNPPENQPLQEPSGPGGEGTSGEGTAVPEATAGMEGEGEVPGSPSGYPDYCSVMSLYNTCYSILLAALSAMSPREPPSGGEEDDHEEEVQEGSSDYKCALCEQFKDNTGV